MRRESRKSQPYLFPPRPRVPRRKIPLGGLEVAEGADGGIAADLMVGCGVTGTFTLENLEN